MGGNRKEYWEQRGRLAYNYKGETFYTVTPIPLYYRRRELLLQLLVSVFEKTAPKIICDFGCGDGWYLNYLSERYADGEWFGVDLSESMIERARQRCPNATLVTSGDGIPIGVSADIVYSIAVFAHVMDDAKVETLFQSIATSLAPNGCFVIFEQTGPRRRQGDVWCRRTPNEYINMAEKANLSIESSVNIAFPVHRFFERRLTPYYYRLFTRGSDPTERCIRANRSFLFRAMSSFMVRLSGNPLRPGNAKKEGNTFYVFRKRAQQCTALDRGSVALHPCQ